MRKLFYTFLGICFVCNMFAQSKFTYIEDRKFQKWTDLIGYNFVPEAYEVPNEYDESLSAGEYTFGISRANIYIKGGEIAGVYNINNSDQTDYGFKVNHMNARDPSAQGHLKIILNKQSQVDALIFKKDRKEKEIIFYMAPTPDRLAEKESNFFTNKFDFEVEVQDSIWNKTLNPFLAIDKIMNMTGRLEMRDSTTIEFTETITITEKKKKSRKNKKKRKKDKEDDEIMEEEEVYASDEELLEEPSEEMNAEEQLMEEDRMAMKALGLEDNKKDYEVKTKIEKEYFIHLKRSIQTENGTREDKSWSYPIKKVVEKENVDAGPGEDRYQLDFTTNKGDHIYMYLTGKRTVSMIEFADQKFLMRGN